MELNCRQQVAAVVVYNAVQLPLMVRARVVFLDSLFVRRGEAKRAGGRVAELAAIGCH